MTVHSWRARAHHAARRMGGCTCQDEGRAATGGTARALRRLDGACAHQTAGRAFPAVQDARRALLVWLRAREPTAGGACNAYWAATRVAAELSRSHMYTNEMIAPPTSWPSGMSDWYVATE